MSDNIIQIQTDAEGDHKTSKVCAVGYVISDPNFIRQLKI